MALGWGSGDGGDVLRCCFPSYNSTAMTESLLQPTNRLDALLERLPPDPRLCGEGFERAAKWFLEIDSACAPELSGPEFGQYAFGNFLAIMEVCQRRERIAFSGLDFRNHRIYKFSTS